MQKCILHTSLRGTGLSIVIQGRVLNGLGSKLGFICFHFAVAGVPHLLSYPRLVRLRSRNAVIDC